MPRALLKVIKMKDGKNTRAERLRNFLIRCLKSTLQHVEDLDAKSRMQRMNTSLGRDADGDNKFVIEDVCALLAMVLRVDVAVLS